MKVSFADCYNIISDLPSLTDEIELPLKEQCDVALVTDTNGNIVVAVSHSEDYREEVDAEATLWGDGPPDPSVRRRASLPSPSSGPKRAYKHSAAPSSSREHSSSPSTSRQLPRSVSPARPSAPGPSRAPAKTRRALSPETEESGHPRKKAKYSNSTKNKRSTLKDKLKNRIPRS